MPTRWRLASIGASVRAPRPRVERNLAQGDAIAAASDLMTHPVDMVGRWWTGLSGPVVAGTGTDARGDPADQRWRHRRATR